MKGEYLILLSSMLALSHNAHTAERKSFLKLFNNGQKRCDVGSVAGPHLAADGLAFIINDGTHYHLHKVRPVVFAESSLADALTAAPLETDQGGIEKNQIRI